MTTSRPRFRLKAIGREWYLMPVNNDMKQETRKTFETLIGKKPHYRITIVPVETVAIFSKITTWVGYNWGLHQVNRLEVAFDSIHDSNAAVGYKKGYKK